MQRTTLLKKIRNLPVYDNTGNIVGLAKDVLSKQLLNIYLSKIIFSNEETRNIFWVECPICGLRGRHLKEHGCNTGDILAPMIYEAICPECNKPFSIDRESRFRGIGCKCGICSMKENQIKHNLEKFGTPYVSKLPEVIKKAKETRKQTNIKKYGKEHVMQVKEIASKNKESRIKSCMQKYGVPSNLCTKEVKSLAKIGRENFLKENKVTSIAQLPGVKEKIENTNLERYGCKRPLGSKEIREKAKTTLFQNFGVEVPSKNKNIYSKIIKTVFERYGVRNVLQLSKNKEKARKKYLEKINQKYGVSSTFLLDWVQKKAHETTGCHWLEKCGKRSPFGMPEIQEKIERTFYQRYGVKCSFSANSPIRTKIAKSRLIPRTERILKTMFENRGISFIHRFVIEKHEFDFALFDNDMNLRCVVDIDGLYYHNIIAEGDSNFLTITYSYDAKRTFNLNEIPFVCVFENDIENGFKEILKTLDMDYYAYINGIFDWCRHQGDFPYQTKSDDELLSSWNKLKTKTEFGQKSNIGYWLVRQFHKSLYKCNVKGFKSPYDAFHDDELLMKAIKNRFIYKHDLEPVRIVDGFTLGKIAPRISLFKPALAKRLILKYLNQYNQIFDPFSGFSGRMLGTIASGKEYIGQDCNPTTIKESSELAKFLNIHPQLSIQDSTKTTGKYECLFTCPPYNLKENWGQEIENHSCDEWIDICMQNYDCNAYLFVVDKTEKYKDSVVETISNKSHLSNSSEYVVLIQK